MPGEEHEPTLVRESERAARGNDFITQKFVV
jgi:hypothetical protein